MAIFWKNNKVKKSFIVDLTEFDDHELRIRRLEKPLKFKVGEIIKWDYTIHYGGCKEGTNYKGEGPIVKIKPIERYKSYDGKYWCYTDNYYCVWDGKELLEIQECWLQ